MKTVPLLCLAIALPITAPVAAISFDQRIALAKAAEGDERFQPYPEALMGKAGRQVAHALRECRAQAPQAMQPFILVADIRRDGRPRAVDVKPQTAFSRCFAAGFAAGAYLPPPDYPGRDAFPVMLRVGRGM